MQIGMTMELLLKGSHELEVGVWMPNELLLNELLMTFKMG